MNKSKIFILFILFLLIVNQINAQDSLLARQDNIANYIRIQPIKIITLRPTRGVINVNTVFGDNLNYRYYGQNPFLLLGEQPSVVSSSESGSQIGVAQITIRGIPSFHLNFFMDGINLSANENNDFSPDVFPNLSGMSNSLSILNGSSNSIWGNNFSGGSTLESRKFKSDTIRHTLGGSYGSYNSVNAFYEFDYGMRNKTGLLIRVSEQYSEGYKRNALYHGQSAFLKATRYFNKGNLDFKFIGGKKENISSWAGVNDSLFKADPKENMNPNKKNNSENYLAQLTYNNRLKSKLTYSISAFYTHTQNLKNADTMNNYSSLQYDSIGVSSTQLSSDMLGSLLHFNYELAEYTDLQFGLNANKYFGEHSGLSPHPDLKYTNHSDKQNIIPYFKIDYEKYKIKIHSEVSIKFVQFNYSGDVSMDKLNWNYITTSSNLKYDRKNSTFIYGISILQREPTRNELFMGYDNLKTDSVGNILMSDRKTERLFDQEIGWHYNKNKINISFNFFLMYFKNERVLNGELNSLGMAMTTLTTKSFRNGVEVNGDYSINPFWKLENRSSFNYSKVKYENQNYIPVLTPSVIINQEVVYQYLQWKFTVFGRYQSSSYVDLVNSKSIPSYFTLGASAMFYLKNFSAKFKLNNLTNTKYVNSAYISPQGDLLYQPQAQFNYQVAVVWTF